MPKIIPPVSFNATGVATFYFVPESGRYVIEVAGAQGGGNAAAQGGKGSRLRGVFNLRAGEVINLVIGQRGLPGLDLPLGEETVTGSFLQEVSSLIPTLARGGGGGGGTFVWKNTLTGGRPDWPMLAAGGGGGASAGPGGDALVTPDASRNDGPGGRNGHGGFSDTGLFYYGGGGGSGWLSAGDQGAGPTYCQGGTHWQGGAGASFGGYSGGHGGYGGGGGGCFFRSGAGGGGGYSGGCGGGGRTSISGGGGGSYNSGAEQSNVPGVQMGDGWVRISFLTPTVTLRVPDFNARDSQPADVPTNLTRKMPVQEILHDQNTPAYAFRLPPTSRWQYQPG